MKIKTKDILPALVPLCIVGLLLYFMVLASKASELAYAPVEYTGSELVVRGQPSGNQVFVGPIVTKTTSFVTVHESLSGAPAQIIGVSAPLPPGEYDSIRIPLEHETLPGYRYIILLMADNGNGVFDAGVDEPVMSDGVVLKRDFVIDEEDDV